jgi:predicted DNA-binding transcriptional regulator AlpA
MTPTTITQEHNKNSRDCNFVFNLGRRMATQRHISREDQEAFDALFARTFSRTVVRSAKDDDAPAPLARLPKELLLTVEEVLRYLPVRISRRAWLEGARNGRYPAAVRINRKTLRWLAGDIQQYVASLTGMGISRKPDDEQSGAG